MFLANSSFIVLYTTNIETAHQFYKNIGAEIKQLETEKVVVSFGSFDLHFILNTEEPQSSYQYIAQPHNYGQGIIFYIETDDIVATHALIEKVGGIIKTPIFKNHWDCQEFLFEDTNGYKFAIYQ